MERWHFGIRRYSDESLIGAMMCSEMLTCWKETFNVNSYFTICERQLETNHMEFALQGSHEKSQLIKDLPSSIVFEANHNCTHCNHHNMELPVWLIDWSEFTETPGWRRMKSEDVSSALALTNNYASQFEVAQVFQNEEEFLHYCLCDSLPGFINTFVVEDPDTGKLTDLISYQLTKNDDLFTASVVLLVAAKSPASQLVSDVLVTAKCAQADILITSQFGLPESDFEDLLFIPKYSSGCWSIYNYRYVQ